MYIYILGTILLIRIWWIVNSRICRKHGCNKYASNIHAQYANNMQYAKKKKYNMQNMQNKTSFFGILYKI